MTIFFVTRHLGALAWAKKQGINYDVNLEHMGTIDHLKPNDIVIGTLPIHLVYALNQKKVRYVHLSLQIPAHLRGQELTVEQLDECQASLQEFHVLQC